MGSVAGTNVNVAC